jgi:hypothetical protein
MTVVAGLVWKHAVHLAADSYGVQGSEVCRHTTPKVWRWGRLVVGASGSILFLQTVRYRVDLVPPDDGDVYTWLICAYVPALKTACREYGGLDKDGDFDGGLLIGGAGRLFRLDGSGGVVEMQDGYETIGSGGVYALGVLTYLRPTITNPVYALRDALRVAITHDVYCHEPIVEIATEV